MMIVIVTLLTMQPFVRRIYEAVPFPQISRLKIMSGYYTQCFNLFALSLLIMDTDRGQFILKKMYFDYN